MVPVSFTCAAGHSIVCIHRKGLPGFVCSRVLNILHLHKFDLNLLVTFDVIMKERSIAGASERLSLSQSAVSHALGRLRKLVEDELFVREADGMRPTARALQLAAPFARALNGIEAALTSQDFNPEHAARTFVIAASDYSCTLIIPELVARLARTAPLIDIYVVSLNGLDVIRQLDERRIDMAIAWFAAVPERLGRAKLLDETYVFIVRAGHPLAAGELTVARVLGFPHVVIDYLGNAERLTDGFFSERGVLRRVHMDRAVIEAPQRSEKHGRVAIKVPSFSNAASVVMRTDMVASIPKRLAKGMLAAHDLIVLDPPFDNSPIAVEAVWPRRAATDPAGEWLRKQVELTAANLD
jgi:DNA-binding transcriptional LysR family regulator